MVETDWRRILNLSQKELTPAEKDDLCESLSWMEADDIELNFSDMKSLFRLAQDILKFKNEQVKTLTGKLEVINRKSVRKKSSKKGSEDSPRRFDGDIEIITHQEEIIKTNKEIIKQLYEDISELEKQRDQLESEQNSEKREIENSDSSRDPMSEIAAVEELEKDLILKNKHIRKLLTDIKICEDENTHLKSKLTILKEKLSDATNVLEKYTNQIYMLSSECSKLKDALGKSQERKTQLAINIDNLKQHISELNSNKDNEVEGLRSKIQHWKNIARSKKSETEALVDENILLKNRIDYNTLIDDASKVCETQKQHMKELEEKLAEASKEIIESAKMIELLKLENIKLKNERSVFYTKSDIQDKQRDRKEQTVKKSLKVFLDSHDNDLKEAEEIITLRENEISELRSELKIYQRGKESMATILENIKSKERELKLKDESVKSLVKEINMLNTLLDSFQLENETMRRKLNIEADAKIPVRGIIKKFKAIEISALEAKKKLLKLENNYVNLKLEKRNSDIIVNKLKNKLIDMGLEESDFNIIMKEEIKERGQGDGPHVNDIPLNENRESIPSTFLANDEDMKAIAEENEGLRKGLQEILDYIKNNGTSSSGILSLESPSLEVVLRSMEARHAAGWFAPHMTTMLELQSAIGGRDALLVALNNARKETLGVMTQLQQQSQKTADMEIKLREMESKENIIQAIDNHLDETHSNYGLFGTWVIDNNNVNDFNTIDKNELEDLILKNNSVHEVNLKNSLEYFHKKFKELYQKMSDISIQASDDLNQWSIKEENYKAEIEKIKSVLASVDEQVSDSSPGVVYNNNDEIKLKRKCVYLEESYKYIRTLNENIKNEHFDYKREAMMQVANYENKIQTLILRVANLTDKLRNSISFDIFSKQNEYLHELNTKYRKLLENKTSSDMKNNFTDLLQKLEQDKNYIIDLYKNRYSKTEANENSIQKMETDITKKQLQSVCNSLEESKKRIQTLEHINEEIQINQSKIIDLNSNPISKEEVNLLKNQLKHLAIENKGLREQCQHVSSQLEIAMLQLQNQQSKQMTNDMEINMLRHQVLDLQSTGDNKAIIAKLSGEVLIAHLQATDNHKIIDRLHLALNKEKQNKVEAEEMLKARENIFDVYASRYDNKFKFMLETINTLRLQYHGSLPVVSLESYINNSEDIFRKNEAADDKLTEIENIREILNAKHSILDELLTVTKVKCIMEDDKCSHYIQKIVNEGVSKRELNLCKKKIEILENSRKDIIKRCNFLEKTLILVNQNVNKLPIDKIIDSKESTSCESLHDLELKDIHSDEEQISRKSQTISLPKPKILSAPKPESDMTKTNKSPPRTLLPGSPLRREFSNAHIQTSNVFVQTNFNNLVRNNKYTQSDEDIIVKDLKSNIILLQDKINIKTRELNEALILISNKNDDILKLNAKTIEMDTKIENLESVNRRKDDLNLKLQNSLADLNVELQNFHSNEKNKLSLNEENNKLINAMKKLEYDKHTVIEEYRQMLQNERDEYANNIRNAQKKILELQSQINRSNRNLSESENTKEIVGKYTVKIVELEDKNFKLQNELDGCKAEISTYESAIERWKSLAIERLQKMEYLNNKLEERHSHEVESYKAENEHWLSQLNDSQKEHSELRSKMNDQKSVLSKQITDKDAHIEHMKGVINNLKTQIMNMQTLILVNDPSFDLSAIIEVDESSDLMSHQASDRLEIKFDSTLDLQEYNEEMEARVPASSSSTIWQEPLIERLRSEKQQICKQNAILRRQIKALAGRERRARLEAQNLKNQVYRMSSSGSKAASAESTVLHNKISALQAQLDNARRDSHNSVALWDKWKRSQQAAERWQARFEEKCREVKKFDTSLNFTKSALTRLEREKKILLAKLNEINSKGDDAEPYRREETEKALREAESEKESRRGSLAGTVSVRALMDRVESQQRKIVALELAEKGNEPLVTEYEKALAEITSLKGQILKLESSVLESQIRSPMTRSQDPQPQLEYWKSYCEMLKEENMQLSLKVSSIDAAHTMPQHQRVNDLEQTVLTLRGLVTKLQSEQKYYSVKRQDSSSPNSGRSIAEKSRGQVEFYRTELSNLRKSLSDKDNLLEKSKDMLRMAAEREEDLLRENAYLRHRLNDMESGKGGFFSA